MVTQSRALPIPLLLTRPEAQGADFAQLLTARFSDAVTIIKTPLLAPRFFAPALPPGPFAALILTSQTGVEGYMRLGQTEVLPKDVFCVGKRTANAAKDAGLRPLAIAPDAAHLILQIKAARPKGALLHLRGRETRGNISNLLHSTGIDTVDVVIYAQDPLPLAHPAVAALLSQTPLLVPLFSPRTAALFATELGRIPAVSPLFIAAMSGEVALEVAALGAQVDVANRPDAAAMADSVAVLLAKVRRA